MATATIDFAATVQDTKSADLGTYSGNPKITDTTSLSSADVTKVFTDGRSLSAPETLDVTAGLTSAYGAALVYSSVKAVVIQNTHGTATIVVGGGANPLFGTDQYTVQPGQTFSVPNVPVAVSGTAKNVLVTPSAAATYNVMILGT